MSARLLALRDCSDAHWPKVHVHADADLSAVFALQRQLLHKQRKVDLHLGLACDKLDRHAMNAGHEKSACRSGGAGRAEGHSGGCGWGAEVSTSAAHLCGAARSPTFALSAAEIPMRKHDFVGVQRSRRLLLQPHTPAHECVST